MEKNFAVLCHAFGAYSRKAARLRDKGDDISSSVMSYSEAETINKSLSENLAKFSGTLTLISDYGDKRVRYIDSKVVGEFSQYESICKNARDEVKSIFVARDKEVMRKRQLDRMRDRNPRNRQQIVRNYEMFIVFRRPYIFEFVSNYCCRLFINNIQSVNCIYNY